MRLVFPALILVAASVTSGSAFADCQEQLQQLGADLRGVALTETQKQKIGGIVDDARRFCWVHREEAALEHIAKARTVAGIKAGVAAFDWETVPLESLEKTPPAGSPEKITR